MKRLRFAHPTPYSVVVELIESVGVVPISVTEEGADMGFIPEVVALFSTEAEAAEVAKAARNSGVPLSHQYP